MDSSLYKSALEDFINKRKSELDYLLNIPIPEFEKSNLSLKEIDMLKAKEIINSANISTSNSVLYYFEIGNTPSQEEIISALKKMKSRKREKLALPKVNSINTSNVLYVGKTNSNFGHRLLDHLGFRSSTTFALHLTKWTPFILESVTLYHATVPNEHVKYLEYLESAMHESLKPMLGREGH
jgi:hypothetical protein